mmetsp:Transcript_42743/g.103379  ORF Transcript_42743/g.103379 Transcript_42743/m.103379 type:complete len:116 (-) Transcript_42743:226-573(-)
MTCFFPSHVQKVSPSSYNNNNKINSPTHHNNDDNVDMAAMKMKRKSPQYTHTLAVTYSSSYARCQTSINQYQSNPTQYLLSLGGLCGIHGSRKNHEQSSSIVLHSSLDTIVNDIH